MFAGTGRLGPRLSCPDPWGVATLFRGDRLGRGQHKGAALGSLLRKQAGNVTRRNPTEKLGWQRAASSPHEWPLPGVVSWGSRAGRGVGTKARRGRRSIILSQGKEKPIEGPQLLRVPRGTKRSGYFSVSSVHTCRDVITGHIKNVPEREVGFKTVRLV